MTKLKSLFTSMKFWVAVAGGGVIAGMRFAGMSEEMIGHVTMIIATLLGAMGLADFGKNATPPK
jgi:hypothetical protein